MTLVCITSSSSNLESPTDPRFGRCAYFIIIDSESMKFEAISNGAGNTPSGAGIRAAQLIASKQVDALITGSVGPNAHSALESSGIKMFSTSANTVKEAIELFKAGKLVEIQSAGPSHMGMGRGRGGGMGRRGGR
jgi:predicted Fe-Mo cluster-binding NifX family protein